VNSLRSSCSIIIKSTDPSFSVYYRRRKTPSVAGSFSDKHPSSLPLGPISADAPRHATSSLRLFNFIIIEEDDRGQLVKEVVCIKVQGKSNQWARFLTAHPTWTVTPSRSAL
ncbi:unnamed protein product, partial [Amoebophrya sp. A25]